MKAISNEILTFTETTISSELTKLDKQLKHIESLKERKVLLDQLQNLSVQSQNIIIKDFLTEKLTNELNNINKKLEKSKYLTDRHKMLTGFSNQVKLK